MLCFEIRSSAENPLLLHSPAHSLGWGWEAQGTGKLGMMRVQRKEDLQFG